MDLDRDEQLRLLKFVCSFAWTDLVVSDEERALVARLADRLQLAEADREQVRAWLRVPPSPDEVDPLDIPREHRQLFLDAVGAVVAADHRVVGSERDSLRLFRELIDA